MNAIHDHSSLISALGGAPALETPLDTLQVNVRAWRARNRIPPEYWPGVIRLAEEAGMIGITGEWLAANLPSRRRPDDPNAPSETQENPPPFPKKAAA